MASPIRRTRARPASRPQIFIGSSTEALPLAETIQRSLSPYADCVVWNQMEWSLGKTALEVLVEAAVSYQYGIFVYAPDDIAIIRRHRYLVARDNVVLEHGLFAGQLGRERVFFVTPQTAAPPLHLPTDLLGLIHGHYDPKLAAKDPKAALATFCASVRSQIKRLQTKLLMLRLRGMIRETSTISGAASGNSIQNKVHRITYKPTDIEIMYDADQQWAEMRYDIRMSGAEIEFDGPCVAKGNVHEGWAYMNYAATDRRTRRLLKGVCLVRIPSTFGGVAFGYWMTNDALSSLSDAITFGVGSTKR